MVRDRTHVEANYGVVPDLQLHLLVPIANDHPVGGPTSCGLGDVEVGVKFRFVQEGEWIPFVGWQGQRRLGEAVTAGAEVFYASPSQVGEPGRARFNVGAAVDLSELHHLLFSAGTAFGAPLAAQGHLAYQLTFGPRERPSTGGAAAPAEPGGPAPLHPRDPTKDCRRRRDEGILRQGFPWSRT